MSTPFIILTTPRTGSTVLTRTLDKHNDIFCAGEIFHTSENIYRPEWHFHFKMTFLRNKFSRKLFKLVNIGNMRTNAVKHIDTFYNTGAEKARGFKLMMAHLKELPQLWNYLYEKKAHVILLIRKNTFRSALSNFRAEKTGVFHSDKNVQMQKVAIDANAFVQRVEELEKINQNLMAKTEGMNRLIIYYEDFKEWDVMMHQIFDFLNVPYQPLEPVLSKISSGNWRNEISNAADIEKVITAKGYAHYLD